jgi:transposase
LALDESTHHAKESIMHTQKQPISSNKSTTTASPPSLPISSPSSPTACQHVLGIDVSKAKLDCALLPALTASKRLDKRFDNNPAGMNALMTWLDHQGSMPQATRVVIEPTGVYHEHLTWLIHERGYTVCLVNPARLRSYGTAIGVVSKNDTIDAALLARYGATEPLLAWQPPSPAAHMLTALLARRDALAADVQRNRNRLEKAQCAKATPKAVSASLKKTINFLQKELAAIEDEIKAHIDGDPSLKQNDALLQSIKGVGPRVAARMNALLSSKAFLSAEALACYIGLNPVEHLSGSSVKRRAQMSKRGSAAMRQLLYLPAVTATRCNPHVKAIYTRMIVRGACKMSAIGAAMRKLAHLCFGVIHSQRPYDPTWRLNGDKPVA